jgi:phosphoribosylformimino-5-aminoimidazole carboxamide ribotide isomerase
MLDFRTIPVIDILNAVAVHAIKGEREKYRPLKGKIIDSSDPLTIMEFLLQNYGLSEFYIADLDAIIKRKPNITLLEKILEIPNIKVMVDPGICGKEDLALYSELKLNKIIIGLETIENFDVIKFGLINYGSDKIVVSIDMYKEKIVSRDKALENHNITDIIDALVSIGVKEIILLDLFRVGQKLGGIPPLFMEIRHIFKGKVIVGGGIKDFNDILQYYKNKYNGVLIATALYDGTIKMENLWNFNKY